METKGKDNLLKSKTPLKVYDNRARAFAAKRQRCVAKVGEQCLPVDSVGGHTGRLRSLLARAHCLCAGQLCFLQFQNCLSDLAMFVADFHELDKHHQNLCIRTAANLRRTSGPKLRWALLGKPMAVDCLACMLCIHKRSFYNALSGKVDMRIGRKARVATKTVDVDRFFLDLYVSVGECLPDKFIRRVLACMGSTC